MRTKENNFKKHPLSKKIQKEIAQRDIDKVKAGTHKWVVDRILRLKKLVRINKS